MADLEGKNFLITGANTGIGLATARSLAARRGRIWLAGRSEAKTRAAIKWIADETGSKALHFLALDLGSLSSVRACAESFLASGHALHVLINNAAVAGRRGMTDSGYEVAFGTNFVGPFLLTELLLARLRDSAPARIVNLASDAHYSAKGIDWDAVRKPTRSRTGLPEYAVSKLANVLHAQELARRLDGAGVTTYALHPGVVASNIWRQVPWPIRPLMKIGMRSTDAGARTPLYCATSDEVAGQSGQYYERCRRKAPGQAATPELAAELRERSERWVGA